MSSSLIKNDYEQWVHTYMTIMSEPFYKLQQGYCEYVSYEAWKRNLYTIPKPDNRTMAQEGWLNFVKGIMSIYDMDDFRAACSKAKQVILSRHDRKDIMELWSHRIMKETSLKIRVQEMKERLNDAKELLTTTKERAERASLTKHRAEFALNTKKCELAIAYEVMKTVTQDHYLASTSYEDAARVVEQLEKTLAETESKL